MFGTVLVGTDGSERANKALCKAVELASATGDRLHVVTAYRPPSLQKLEKIRATAPEEVQWRLSADSEAQAILADAERRVHESGITCETWAEQGDPDTVILDVAERVGAELIVVGSKGVERRILGSVPNSISQHADCDVWIVHTS